MTDSEAKFAVVAQKKEKEYDKPLYLHDLTFARLIDDVVVPYETDKPFFIDGVPMKRNELARIKIIQQSQDFSKELEQLHWCVRLPTGSGRRVSMAEYPGRLDALFRAGGEDVTSQVIQAFDAKIRPKLKVYLPKREELISAAFQLFVESMKRLGSVGVLQ